MAREGSSARVVRNTLINGLGVSSGIMVSLVLTPFLIIGLGKEAFGVWALALSFSFLGGYASAADLGIEAAAIRFIAEARSDGDREALDETASTTLVFFAAAGLVLGIALAAASFPLVSLFQIEGSLRDDAIVCFAFMGLQLIFELPARASFAVLEGAQRYASYQFVELVRTVVQAALFAAVLVGDVGVAGLGAATAASSLAVLVSGTVLARRAVPEIRVRPGSVSRRRFRMLLSFGGWYFLIRVLSSIYRQIDKAILAIALGPRSVATYEVAYRIQLGVLAVQSVASSSLLPATAYVRAQKEVLRDLFLRGTTYTLAALLPVALATMFLAEPLIRTWIGESVVDAAGPTRLFMVFLLLAGFHATAGAMLVALGRMRFMVTVVVVYCVINVGLSIALVGPLGVDGVVLGLVIAEALIWIPYLVYSFRVFDIELGKWLRRVIWPNAVGAAAQCATAPLVVIEASDTSSLIVVGLLLLVSVTVSVVAFLFVGLPRLERSVLLATIGAALRPNRKAHGHNPAT